MSRYGLRYWKKSKLSYRQTKQLSINYRSSLLKKGCQNNDNNAFNLHFGKGYGKILPFMGLKEEGHIVAHAENAPGF